jgi:hypothetical protein
MMMESCLICPLFVDLDGLIFVKSLEIRRLWFDFQLDRIFSLYTPDRKVSGQLEQEKKKLSADS